jgi:signal transduction histidine kinase
MVPAAQVDTHVDEWLGIVARHIDVERGALWEFSADGTTLRPRHFYASSAEGTPIQELPSTRFQWLTDQSLRGNVVAWLRIPEDIPAQAAEERAYAIGQGAKAVLSVPIQSGSSLYVLVFTTRKERSAWSERLIFSLRLIGGIFATAIERARAQVSLQSIERRQRAILRALPDLMFVLSPGCVYLDYYARDESELLMPPAEFIGRTVEEVLPPEVARGIRIAHERALAGQVVTHEFELRIKGELQRFEARMVRTEDGAVVNIVRNLSESTRARIENERLRLELAHAGRMILMGHLSASLAHELLQPITAVIHNAETAKFQLNGGACDPRELSEILEDIIASGLRAGEVIERVRGHLRKEPRTYQCLDLNRLVRDIARIVHNELTGRHVSLALELASSLPAVRGDPIELQQVMLNLLLNGAEAMAATLPTDRVLILRTLAVGSSVQISFCDRGPGVSPAELHRLFEPFFSTKPAGLGMGLFISSEIVRAHGGELLARRLDAGGMEFYFVLPHAP